jgi:glycosyltransferase involved in cell wall biosynthesis
MSVKNAKPRIAFIIQRYGEQITGGAESHCRQLAERLVTRYDVEVLTTCATDHLSWKNTLPEGLQTLHGVAIRRFRSVGERNPLEFHKIYGRIFLTQLTAAEEYEMIRLQGPHTPDLIEYVRAHQQDYDAFVVYTYLYYTAVHTLPLLKSKALFIPTAHDETALYTHILDEVFRQTPHMIFLSEEEQFLLQRRFSLPSAVGRVGGLGFDEPDPGEPDPAWEELRRKLENRLVLTFVGRVEDGKGCDELVDFFLRFVKEEAGEDLTLLLLGRRTLPLAPHPRILSPGFVSEYVKFQALEMTAIGLAPAPCESLCMAALETWMHARPMLVNGRSPVLTGHCVRSNGGLWYTNYREFREALKVLLSDPARRMALGAQGRAYVRSRYRWDDVESVYVDAIERVIAEAAGPA